MNTANDFTTSISILIVLFAAVFSRHGLRTLKMVADAVIYHPTVAHYLKYVATTGTYSS
jgi:hypothetical protein